MPGTFDNRRQTELPDSVHFGRAICCDLTQASRREWWLANGLGGYAGGTIAQCLTCRYHGLLIAPVHPPLGRMLVFAKADATLRDNEHSWPLFTNCWGSGAVEPRGLVHLESFRLDGGMPVWRFAIGDLILEQCIWMERKRHATGIGWRLVHTVERPVHLDIDLLVNSRGHHDESQPHEFSPVIEGGGSQLSVRHLVRNTSGHVSGPALHFNTHDGQLSIRRQWIHDFDLPRERERGLPDRDSHLCTARMRLPLRTEWSGLVATVTATPTNGAQPHCAEMLRRRRAYDIARLTAAATLIPELREAPCWIRQLVVAADSFLIARPVEGQEGKDPQEPPEHHGESIIAGYPWFNDWGRDAMIALPGLTLATGRYASARDILTTFARFVDQGMLPNTFPNRADRADNGEPPQYNTVDAALWYFEAWRAYVSVSNDIAALAVCRTSHQFRPQLGTAGQI